MLARDPATFQAARQQLRSIDLLQPVICIMCSPDNQTLFCLDDVAHTLSIDILAVASAVARHKTIRLMQQMTAL